MRHCAGKDRAAGALLVAALLSEGNSGRCEEDNHDKAHLRSVGEFNSLRKTAGLTLPGHGGAED